MIDKEDRRIEKKIKKIEKKGDVTGLIKALKHETFYFRKCAAEALGRLGDARAVQPLIPLLKDSMANTTAWALGEIGDARAVDPLIQTLQSNNLDDQRAAAKALGRIEDARGVKALIQVLQDRYKPNRIRAGVAKALGAIGDARAVDPLIQALQESYAALERANVQMEQAYRYDEDIINWDTIHISNIRALIEALGDIGDPRAIETLIQARNDYPRIANEALEKIKAKELVGSLELDPRLERALAALTSRINPSIGLTHSDRESAIQLLKILHRNKIQLNPNNMKIWALQNGWNSYSANQLRDLA